MEPEPQDQRKRSLWALGSIPAAALAALPFVLQDKVESLEERVRTNEGRITRLEIEAAVRGTQFEQAAKRVEQLEDALFVASYARGESNLGERKTWRKR